MKRVALLVFFFFSSAPVVWAMSSSNYSIQWDAFSGGGLDSSTSTNYAIRDTIGEPLIGTATSTNYELRQGYRGGDGQEMRLALTVKSQSGSGAAYTQFDQVLKKFWTADGTAVAGDYVAVIENRGFAQRVAVGKVTSVQDLGGSYAVSVDTWEGDHASMSGTPSGANDYYYILSGQAVSFGSVNAGEEQTSVTMTSVESQSSTGYTVYLQANRLLQNAGADTIASVTDGTVSTGSEEYGMSATGTYAYLSGIDLAVSTTQRIVQSRSAATSDPADRVAMVYKLSIVSGTDAGAYSQSVYYTLTANY